VREAARLLVVAAGDPRINARPRGAVTGIALLVELAELLQAAVSGGAIGELSVAPSARRRRVGRGRRHPQPRVRAAAARVPPARARTRRRSTSPALGLFIKSNLQDFQHMADADVDIAADSEATLPLSSKEVKRQLTVDHQACHPGARRDRSPTRTATRASRRWKQPPSAGLEPDRLARRPRNSGIRSRRTGPLVS
jgi:hypothetical protein